MFDPEARQLKCGFCGHEQDLGLDAAPGVEERDLERALSREAERRQEGQVASSRLTVRCEDCGGEATFEGTLTARSCPYCASPLQVRDAHRDATRIPADGMLTFTLPQAAAAERFGGWIRSRWFAPSRFRDLGARGKFDGVYLPFWTFDSLTGTVYRGQRGDHYWVSVQRGKETVQERRTRWSVASGSFRRFFDDVLVRGVSGDDKSLPTRLLDSLEPWPLDAVKSFAEAAIAGFYARTYDVDLATAFRTAKSEMEAALREQVRQRIGGDEQRIDEIRSRFSALTYKHLLLPVWMLTYRFRNRPYRVAVNGVTGEVRGERPYSWVKIAATVLAIGVAVAAVVLLTAR